MTNSVIATILYDLGIVASESQKTLRKFQLAKLLDTTCEASKDMLSLILSFQMCELWRTPSPRFNTVPLVNWEADIISWFKHPRKELYRSLPYYSQQLIYFMSSFSTLGLDLKALTGLKFTYVDPYKWLTENLAEEAPAPICHLCGIESVQEICLSCTYHLKSFTAYRIQDFILTINTNTSKHVPTKNFGHIYKTIGNFRVERLTTTELYFRLVAKNIQLPLPFPEYQREII